VIWRLSVAGLSLGLPAWGWMADGGKYHWAGLAAMLVLGVLVVPNVLVWALFAGQHARWALIPRHWRIAYRQAHGRDGAKSPFIPVLTRRIAVKSSFIPARTRRIIGSADRHRCVYWRHRRRPVQVDHIIPWAAGGPALLYNLMVLCSECNLVKLNYSRDRNGYEHYRRQIRNRGNLHAARRILAAERRRRCSPLRGIRIAWALGA